MADNVPVNPGTAAGAKDIATDDVGGVHYQTIKLDVGGDGASVPVVGALPVTGTFFQATQPVSAAVLPLPAGAATEITLTTRAGDRTSAAAPFSVRLSDGAAFLDPRDVSDRSARILGHVVVDSAPAGPSTSLRSSVMVSASVVTVLAANASRKGASLYHDGSAGNCFVALGAGATTSDFTLRMQANDYYEVPFGYTGIITAIRASGTNPLRVTEMI